VEQRGIEVVIALDTSSSMLAQDVEPNRLGQAKLVIADLMDMLPGAQFALVVFAGESFIQFPLTTDVGAALMLVNAADTNVVSLPGTAIGDAIRTSLRAFNERSAGQRVLVLFTDGEDHDTDPLGAAEEAAAEGVMIYPIGFGNPAGEPIPEFDAQGNQAGYKRGEQGNIVLSRLDEATLRQIARTTGGEYFRATPGGQEMRGLADELNALVHGETQSKMLVQHIERFQIPAFLALLALVGEFLLSDRRSQREVPHV
jgi:Ca-activated chloride channel family protein